MRRSPARPAEAAWQTANILSIRVAGVPHCAVAGARRAAARPRAWHAHAPGCYRRGMDYRTSAETLQPDRSILVVGTRGTLFGLDRMTGAVVWSNGLPGGGFGEVFMAVGYGVVIASAHAGVLYCLDYLTGVERWRQNTTTSGRATILIEPEQIVCAKSGYLDCYAPDGRPLWSQSLDGAGFGRVALGYPGNVAQADDPGKE
jgi:hypothetical protein